ncbi:MAG TPA: hypothetical protein ENI29_15720, partial [bacterium]|nr:hypothetical protein [bacterium]
ESLPKKEQSIIENKILEELIQVNKNISTIKDIQTKIACQYMDVVTTSGIGTGLAADPEKIKIMSLIVKKYDKKLGIASGITFNNVEYYKSVTYFLVATGISKDFHTFNPILVKKLSDKINKLKQIQE